MNIKMRNFILLELSLYNLSLLGELAPCKSKKCFIISTRHGCILCNFDRKSVTVYDANLVMKIVMSYVQ